MGKQNAILVLAGLLSFTAALLHVAIIFGGPDWYRFFGAGEKMAQLAEEGSLIPVMVTLIVSLVLTVWGLYALSAAGLILQLPFLKIIMVLITGVYCTRGIYGFFLPFIFDHPDVQSMSLAFWMWSSLICLCIGLTHLLGLKKVWSELS